MSKRTHTTCFFLQLRVWSECRSVKEATVREIGITEPERTVNSMVTSHDSCILERTQCMQVSTAAMYYHRFYIGNMPR